MLDTIKSALSNIFVQWLFRVLGVIFSFFAVNEQQVYQIVFGAMGVIVAFIGEKIQHDKLLNTTPPV